MRHPEDWAPVALTGNRDAGYVRLQGSGRLGGQVRWQRSQKSADLERLADDYFRLLKRDAKRARVVPRLDRKTDTMGGVGYWFSGAFQHRGSIVASPDGRIFLIEAFGGTSDSLMPPLGAMLREFGWTLSKPFEAWALFGLHLVLPTGLSPSAKVLQSGRTWLTFKPKRATIEAGRYAFGEELVQRHGLEGWARAALALGDAEAAQEEGGVRLHRAGSKLKPTVEALIRLESAQNQIVAVRSAYHNAKWKPEWRWLASSDS